MSRVLLAAPFLGKAQYACGHWQTAPAEGRGAARSGDFRKHLLLASTALVAASIGVLANVGPAQAASGTWNGATGVYETNANWTGASAPIGAGDTATFSNTGAATTITVGAPLSINQWIFDAAAQSYTLGGAAVTLNNATGIINQSATNQTINNIIAGGGSVRNAGTGTLTLTGINTYGGGTALSGGGIVSVANDNGLGGAGNALNFNTAGGTLQFTGTTTSNRVFSLTGGLNGIDVTGANVVTLTNALPGVGGGLTKSGTGTLILNAGTNIYWAAPPSPAARSHSPPNQLRGLWSPSTAGSTTLVRSSRSGPSTISS